MVKRDTLYMIGYVVLFGFVGYWFGLSWLMVGVLVSVATYFVMRMHAYVVAFRHDCQRQQWLYHQMLHMCVNYRHTRSLAGMLEGYEDDAFGDVVAQLKTGNSAFALLYGINRHYLFVYIVTLIEMDVMFGDDGVVEAMYHAEASVDIWNRSIRNYQDNLKKQMRKMSFLILFTLVLCQLILNLMRSIVALNASVIYQITMLVFLVFIQCFGLMTLGVLKKGCIFDHETLT